MTCILEGVFLRASGKFILKEVAFYVVESEEASVFNFKPPFSYEELSYVDKRLCSWISSNICDLKWDDGDLEYSKLNEVALTISGKGKTFFTKGVEKAKFFTDFLGVQVVNIEDLGCPKLTTLSDPIQLTCKYHLNNANCALFKAYRLSFWMKNYFQVL